jgi:phospholipid-binding lipoprotein MlaA
MKAFLKTIPYLRPLVLVASVLVTACGTNPKDPLEPFNRGAFEINQTIDRAVGRPVAKAYVAVVPSPVRIGVANFFNNLSDLTSSVNCLLQTKAACAGENFLRFSVNSVFGLFGVLDVAGEAGIPRTREDFGQTLGHYGVPTGPFLMVPVFGATTVRDLIGTQIAVDRYTDPFRQADEPGGKAFLLGLGLVSFRASQLAASDMLTDIALDPYAFYRDAHMQRRRSLVFDGSPPEEDEPAPAAPSAPSEPAKPATSAPKTSLAPSTGNSSALVTEWGANVNGDQSSSIAALAVAPAAKSPK